MAHNIPIGQHVIVSIEDEQVGSGCWIKGVAELIVAGHIFDCDVDRTPLYNLCSEPIRMDAGSDNNISLARNPFVMWFELSRSEDELRPIPGKVSEMKYASTQEYLRILRQA